MKVWPILLLIAQFVCGCSGEPASPSQNPGDAGHFGSSTECIVGWWLTGSVECRTACANLSECSEPDCSVEPILGLLEDGTSVQSFIAVAPGIRQFSALSPNISDAWTLSNDGKLKTAAQSNAIDFDCTVNRLTLGLVTYERASSDLHAAIQMAYENDQWQNVSY